MQRITVESSDLVAIGYDAKIRTLEIEFKESRIYQYFDVEPEVYERFLRAESYGEFFYAFVNRRYRYKRVDGDKEGPANAPLAFVANNLRVVHDLRAAIEPHAIAIEQVDLDIDNSLSDDPKKITQQRAKEAYKLLRRPVLLAETHWNILALRGFPGGYMDAVVGWLRAEDFLLLMSDKKDHTVSCTDIVVYFDGKRIKLFSQDRWGSIVDVPRGQSDYAFWRVVALEGSDKTVAELEEEGNNVVPAESVWHDFAKWYAFQRRLQRT